MTYASLRCVQAVGTVAQASALSLGSELARSSLGKNKHIHVAKLTISAAENLSML